MILLVFLGGFEGIMNAAEKADFASAQMVQVLRFLGMSVILVMLLLAPPSVAAGMGLLKFKSWARSLAMVVSVLQIANIPMGTMLSLYSFWVLMSPETEPLFTNPPIR